MKKNVLVVILISLIISSCREERILDFIEAEELTLVVEGTLTDENRRHFVRIAESGNYYESKSSNPATGAAVSINGVDLIELSHPDSLGYYTTPIGFKAIANNTYQLLISYKNRNYTAAGFMNETPNIDSIRIKRNRDIPDFVGIELYDVDIYYVEDKSRKAYYSYDLFVDGEWLTESINDKAFFENDFLIEGPVTFTAQNFSDLDVDLDKELQIVLQKSSLNTETFKFYTDFFNQTEGTNNPFFAPPPANISTNLSEGAFGFFEVYSLKRDTILFTPGS